MTQVGGEQFLVILRDSMDKPGVASAGVNTSVVELIRIKTRLISNRQF